MKRLGILPWSFRDDINALTDFLHWPFEGSWTYSGQFVDTDKYDIVPKASYKKELIAKKEAEIKQLDEKRETAQKELEKLKGEE